MSTAVTPKKQRKIGVRSVAALLVFIVALLITPVALIGHWGHRTMIDTSRYLETVGPLAADPAIQESVSQAVTNAITSQINTEELVGGLLGNIVENPAIQDKLSGPIAAGINGLIGQAVSTFVASDAFEQIWITVNTAVQKSALLILEGKEGGPVSLQGENVVLDVSPLISAVQQSLVDRGVSVAANIPIPEIDKQIVLFQSPALAQLRTLYSLTSPLLAWFPLLLAALFALAIWLARRKGRMVLATGVALIVMTGATKLLLDSAQTIFTDQLAGTLFAPASQAFWDTFFKYLVLGIRSMIVLGVVIAIAGWLGSRISTAAKVRGWLTTGLEGFGSELGSTGIARSMAARADLWRTLAAAIGVIILATGDVLSTWHVIWTVLLTAGLFAGIQVLIGSTKEIVVEETVVEEIVVVVD
ncbi:MAG: hypothetical protein ACR2JS_01865 [Candidatus Nanopelagicales bacterium]